MPELKENVFIKQSGTPSNQDRCTVVITAHYQEWEPNNVTFTKVAYDRLLPQECLPLQTSIRVNPGQRVAVPLGDNTPGKCEVVLAHETPKVRDGALADILKVSQANNTIRIFNADGVEIGIIYPNRGCLMHFAGDIFVESTMATAILKVTVLPA